VIKLIAMFFACYLYVFTRAFQQRNVVHDNYGWIIPTSYAMATLDVFIIAYIAHSGWSLSLIAVNGGGSGLGCLTAMLLHKRWVKH